ncbi:MAG: hypothetical protein ACLU6W_06565 [Lachnospiraceae bacterium]
MRFKSRISYLLEFLHTYLVLLALMTIPIGIQTYTSPWVLLGKTLFILAAIIILFFAERHCRSIFTFFLICLPLLVIPYLIRTNGIDFAYQLAAVIILIVSYTICRLGSSTPWMQEPSIYYEALFLVIYFLGIYLKNEWLQNCMIYYAMGYLLLILIYTNISNMGRFLRLNRDVANLPAGQIKSVNRIILLILSVITIAAMILVPLSGLGNVITGLGNAVFQFIRWFIGLFTSRDDPSAPALIETPQFELPDLEPSDTGASSFWLWEFLTAAAFFAASAALVAAVIFGIYYLVRHFYRPASDGDEKLFIKKAPFEETRTSLPKSSLKKAEKLGRDPNGTVRRIYKKTILKYADETPPEFFTPKELEEFSNLPDTEDSRRLHCLYEQARYSAHGVTKEEAAAAKNLHIS